MANPYTMSGVVPSPRSYLDNVMREATDRSDSASFLVASVSRQGKSWGHLQLASWCRALSFTMIRMSLILYLNVYIRNRPRWIWRR